ncbi:hypothetical protein Tco_1006791 [Tanacetum coccineum]|uniref:Uncharacterized protein n=1 Tax=Tanacetum coccineum TaxID=301880 RepID=A0ABQ5FK37_9ASTR
MKCLEASSRVNAAGTKITTAERLQLLKDKDCLKIKITYVISSSFSSSLSKLIGFSVLFCSSFGFSGGL